MSQKNFRLPEEVINVLKMKAAVYTRGNLSEFVRQAIEAYQEPLPHGPCLCGGETEQVLEETVTWSDVTFTHVPMYRCKRCGREGVDLEVVAVLEEYAQRGESLDIAAIIHPRATTGPVN